MKNLLPLVFLLSLVACRRNNATIRIIPSLVRQIDQSPGDCPYLTKDIQGNPVLSWVRTVNDTASVFCYAVSKDGGKTFTGAVTIPSSKNIAAHSENLPKIVFKPSGEVIAVWGSKNTDPRNKYSGLIYYSQSFNDGQTWSPAKRLVTDTSGYDQRYYDIALMRNGEVAMIWLDNRTPGASKGSAVYFAKTRGPFGFEGEKKISGPACPCCRTSLFADSRNNLHALYRGIIHDSIRDMVHTVSSAGGSSFSRPALIHNDNWVINGCPHTGPAMAETRSGLHFAWYTGGKSHGSFYTRSADNGNTYTAYDGISDKGSHPQIAKLSANNLAIVWDEPVETDSAIFKSIGFQVRDDNGGRLAGKITTPAGMYASYPVISVTEPHSAVLAFSLKKGNRNYIAYQRVSIQ